MNVLSIAGIPGIGENIVTHGLGPGPSSPTPTPTPTPVRPKVLPGQQQSGAGGGGSATRATNCEPIWREEWRERLREQKRKQHEREMRAELDRIEKLKAQQAESVIDELLEEGPPAEPPTTDVVIESVYEPLAVGIQGRVRAAVEGVVHYKTDKVVEIVADDGARHVYEGVKKIAAGPVEGDRVDEGETIGRAVRTVVDHRIEREVPAPAVAVGPYPRSELATQAEPWTRVEAWPSSVPQVSPSPVASSPPPPPVRIERGVPVATVEARVSAVTQSLPAFPYPRTDQATRTDPDVQGPGKPETLGTPPTESTAVSLGKAALVVAAAAAGVVLIAKAGSSTPGPSRKARASRASEATPSVKKAAKAPVFRFKSLKNPLPRPAGSPAAQPEPKPRTRRSTKGKPVQEVALEPARSKRARPIEDVVDYPPHAKIQEKWIRCGKPDCYSCPHGPYLQAMWWGDDGKVKTKYLGKKTK